MYKTKKYIGLGDRVKVYYCKKCTPDKITVLIRADRLTEHEIEFYKQIQNIADSIKTMERNESLTYEQWLNYENSISNS